MRHQTAFHTCVDTPNPCFAKEEEARTATTHHEFIKYAALLAAATRPRTDTRAEVVKQYKESWDLVYRNEPCKMTEEGLPYDYSQDSRFPGSRNDAGTSTLGPLPSLSRHTPVPSSSCRRTPIPSSSRHTPVPSSSPHPAASSSRLTPVPPSPFSHHPQAASSLPPPPADHDVVMRVLRQKTFPTTLKPVFSSISGFGPGFDATADPSGCVRVLFIENIEHALGDNPQTGIFISEENIDVDHYDRLFNTFPNSILKKGRTSKDGKVTCLIVTWVSRSKINNF